MFKTKRIYDNYYKFWQIRISQHKTPKQGKEKINDCLPFREETKN